jgi:hypothetical protein
MFFHLNLILAGNDKEQSSLIRGKIFKSSYTRNNLFPTDVDDVSKEIV